MQRQIFEKLLTNLSLSAFRRPNFPKQLDKLRKEVIKSADFLYKGNSIYCHETL